MDKHDYQMSEKAFMDIWEKYNSPKEIYGSKDCYKFLTDLHSVTGGWVILDHFSHTNYDKVRKITYKNNFTSLTWENLDENPRGFQDELLYVYGAHYIYSFCDIQKIKFLNLDGHLILLILPRALTMKEVKNALGISRIPQGQIFEQNHPEELSTDIKFFRNDKIHHCIVHGLPFYSFLIQPKERDIDTSSSKKIMMLQTLTEAVERAKKMKNKIENDVEDYEQDEITGCGNTLRKVLENVLKYYCLCFGFSLPNEAYGKNQLGMIKEHLKTKNDTIGLELINQEMINLANGLSHDSGKFFTKKDVLKLYQYVVDVSEEIYGLIRRKEISFHN